MKARPEDIERLLNGYIDDELTVRQKTEVKRLLGNDPRTAGRLRQLEKCKTLISSLPTAEAPPDMAQDVMAKLARRSLLGEEAAAVNERAGTRDLFLRKILTAAAMIALLGVLGMVVYTIVAAQDVPGPPRVAGGNRTTDIIDTPPIVLAKFNGRLELKTAAFKEMDAFVDRAVAENDLVRCTAVERLDDRTTYLLTCGRKGLNALLERLDKNWPRLDSATLFVETNLFDRPVAIHAVTTDQIAEITTQTTSQDALRVARDLALLNDVTEQLRSRTVLLASDSHLIDMDRWPVTTGGTNPIEKAAVDKPNVELVIVLTDSN